MKIEVRLRIEAPPMVVFRFYTLLDHLRFICPPKRHEWAPKVGASIALGEESEAKIRQAGHTATVRFKTVSLEHDRFFEDEFTSWPLKGARHTVTLEPRSEGLATQLDNVITWDPPWYLKRLADRHEQEQRAFFSERQENAKRIIEAVYRARGDRAFESGIVQDAALAGIEPIVKL